MYRRSIRGLLIIWRPYAPEKLQRAFRDTLISGGYNLLLGAGISLDSIDSKGRNLPNAEALREELCRATGANPTTTMTRVVPLLTEGQRERLLVDRFSGCTPGPTVRRLSHYMWRRAFTLNIDDVVEAHYRSTKNPKQSLETFNYDHPLEPTPGRSTPNLIHLHGFACEPSIPFVFSAQEYARVMRELNPWMHMLSEILATEPFIVGGTTLNEVDLEFYLRQRTTETPRRGTGPSLLIEPSPDVATRADCKRYGLALVEATFGEFMNWVHKFVPSPPSITELLVPDTSALFHEDVEKRDLLRFFADFELLSAGEQPLSDIPTAFLYGRAPTWNELDQHIDIARADSDRISALLDRKDAKPPKAVIVIDEPGSGKTTAVRRIAHGMVRRGQPVLNVKTLSGIDMPAATKCLSKLKVPVIVLVDDVADHASQIAGLLEEEKLSERVALLGADRSYRREYLDILLGEFEPTFTSLEQWSTPEYQQLLERYRRFGLVAEGQAIQAPEQFARRLTNDVVAVAICRILNDFRPLDSIVDSLWDASYPSLRPAYLCAALAQHCHRSGLRYSLAQSIAGPRAPVGVLLESSAPLRLTESTIEQEYLVPINAAIGERLVLRIAKKDSQSMQNAFQALARALGPHVNRRAVMKRTPEARLAGRLFDADTIVKPLLGTGAAEFYVGAQEAWEWNSRYWEQRALLTIERDLKTSLRYARHALAIERHPFPMTTLGKVLLATMEAEPSGMDEAYSEAVVVLSEAIETEASRSRRSVHPFVTLLNGTSRYLELGGVLSAQNWQTVERYTGEAEYTFKRHSVVTAATRRLDSLLPDE